MKLTLIQQNKVNFLYLPDEVTGQYILMFSRQDGSEEALLSIRPEKGKWLAESGMNSYFTVDGKNYRACPVDRPGLCLGVFIRTTGEIAQLISEDDSSEMTRFHKFSAKGRVVIGRAPDCDIILRSAIVQEHCAEIIR